MSRTITYLFSLEDGSEHRFDVEVERAVRNTAANDTLPAWTALQQGKCPHCPLPDAPGARCPAAVDLVPMVSRFSELASIARASVRVLTAEREVRKNTDVQTALGALMGLVMATSGCPILARLRPLAQTHLPFASTTDTVYRMLAMQLFGCFLRGEPASFDGLRQFVADLDRLNTAFIERLRLAVDKDAGLNALLKLQTRSLLASFMIDTELERIRAWFEPSGSSHPASNRA